MTEAIASSISPRSGVEATVRPDRASSVVTTVSRPTCVALNIVAPSGVATVPGPPATSAPEATSIAASPPSVVASSTAPVSGRSSGTAGGLAPPPPVVHAASDTTATAKADEPAM